MKSWANFLYYSTVQFHSLSNMEKETEKTGPISICLFSSQATKPSSQATKPSSQANKPSSQATKPSSQATITF